jgi:hypothetical protein
MAYSVQGRPKKARQVKSNVMSMLIIFFDIKRILHKEFVLTSQTVNSAYYCAVLSNCMKMREDSAQKNWLLHHDNAPSHFFSPGNF